MEISIVESTHRFLAGLDHDTLRAAELSARACSRQAVGCELALQEVLELLVSAKALAVGDDFARGEAQGLRMWLTRFAMPLVIQRHLLDVDPGSLDLEELSTPVVPGGLQARRLFWLVVSLASFEGLRQGARTRAEGLAQRLGISPSLGRVLVEEAQISVSALLQGDEPLLRRLSELRAAIFLLAPDAG